MHKNIRSHAICLNLHGAAQIAAIHGVVCYAVTNQIAVKSEVGDLMCNAEPPTNSGVAAIHINRKATFRSEEHTSELQSLMRISYAVFCLKKKTINTSSITCLILNNNKIIKYNANNSLIQIPI